MEKTIKMINSALRLYDCRYHPPYVSVRQNIMMYQEDRVAGKVENLRLLEVDLGDGNKITRSVITVIINTINNFKRITHDTKSITSMVCATDKRCGMMKKLCDLFSLEFPAPPQDFDITKHLDDPKEAYAMWDDVADRGETWDILRENGVIPIMIQRENRLNMRRDCVRFMAPFELSSMFCQKLSLCDDPNYMSMTKIPREYSIEMSKNHIQVINHCGRDETIDIDTLRSKGYGIFGISAVYFGNVTPIEEVALEMLESFNIHGMWTLRSLSEFDTHLLLKIKDYRDFIEAATPHISNELFAENSFFSYDFSSTFLKYYLSRTMHDMAIRHSKYADNPSVYFEFGNFLVSYEKCISSEYVEYRPIPTPTPTLIPGNSIQSPSTHQEKLAIFKLLEPVIDYIPVHGLCREMPKFASEDMYAIEMTYCNALYTELSKVFNTRKCNYLLHARYFKM